MQILFLKLFIIQTGYWYTIFIRGGNLFVHKHYCATYFTFTFISLQIHIKINSWFCVCLINSFKNLPQESLADFDWTLYIIFLSHSLDMVNLKLFWIFTRRCQILNLTMYRQYVKQKLYTYIVSSKSGNIISLYISVVIV